MNYTTTINQKFLTNKRNGRYVLSTPVTMMEDEMVNISKEWVVSEKIDGTRSMVIYTNGSSISLIDDETTIEKTQFSGDYVLDCEIVKGEIVILDVLYANEDVTCLPLRERLKKAQHLHRLQQYYDIAQLPQLREAVEGWILQDSRQDYVDGMILYKVKRVPTIDILMNEEECDLYDVPYKSEYDNKIVEVSLDGRYARLRMDKSEPNSFNTIAREMADDRVSWSKLYEYVSHVLGVEIILESQQEGSIEVKLESVVRFHSEALENGYSRCAARRNRVGARYVKVTGDHNIRVFNDGRGCQKIDGTPYWWKKRKNSKVQYESDFARAQRTGDFGSSSDEWLNNSGFSRGPLRRRDYDYHGIKGHSPKRKKN